MVKKLNQVLQLILEPQKYHQKSLKEIIKTITEPTSINKDGKNYFEQIINKIEKLNNLKFKKIGIAITGRVDQSGNWYPVNEENLGTLKYL